MSRLYDAIKRIEIAQAPKTATTGETAGPEAARTFGLEDSSTRVGLENASSLKVAAASSSRLVALNDPHSLGAEKFRALGTRLENLRHKMDLRSLQITSGSIGEGKSLVSANLALTFAKRSDSKVLLIEGDLHRPTLSALLGLKNVRGLSNWVTEPEEEITKYLYFLSNIPMWYLSAGNPSEQPSDVIRSARFAEAFGQLASSFDWIVVDSTPMLPIADANLWSRLVTGTLLVVREGVASVKALHKGLESLDNPKLIGIVLNDASESSDTGYAYGYYGVKDRK